jgi:solute carrier family 45, member 1/2/4
MSSMMKAAIIEDAVRKGSLASLVFSITSLLTNIIIPFFVADPVTSHSKPAVTETPSRKISITKAWASSHILLAVAMFSTIFITTRTTATILVSFIGISWAFTLWVPFAVIGSEIAARQEHNANVMVGDLGPTRQDQAGAIIGLHNCAISAPQIVAALVSSFIFWVAKSMGSEDGIGWVLRAGGGAALVAGLLASRMDR